MFTARTRSNPYFDSPLKAPSPMRPKHAVTPVRRPPKRRKLGTGLRSRLFADSDSDQPSERLSRVASGHAATTRSGSQTRRAELSLKIPARALNAQSELSPRKRKRTDRAAPSSDGDSWIETEDEAPEFIAEGEYLQGMTPDTVQMIRIFSVLPRLTRCIGYGKTNLSVCGRWLACGPKKTRKVGYERRVRWTW